MKPTLILALDKIAGTKLSTQEKEMIADEAIKILQDFNRNAANAALSVAKDVITKPLSNGKDH